MVAGQILCASSHHVKLLLFSPSVLLIKPKPSAFNNNINVVPCHSRHAQLISTTHGLTAISRASSSASNCINQENDETQGVSLGTMKLPSDTDIPRFETLLFQWGNSLSQGANLPLAVPLKVDKIPGGARLGFVTIEDAGKTQVDVFIDCLVFPADGGSGGPMFRAIRKGPMKDKVPPGEPRIMRSLLDALTKCVQIARQSSFH